MTDSGPDPVAVFLRQHGHRLKSGKPRHLRAAPPPPPCDRPPPPSLSPPATLGHAAPTAGTLRLRDPNGHVVDAAPDDAPALLAAGYVRDEPDTPKEKP